MYRIIGTDGKEYGPITGEQLKRWLAEGRVDAMTSVRTEDGSGWKPLSQFPEFASGASAPHLPPPLGAVPAHGAAPRTSGLAITSLVLGLLGFFTCGLTALVGLILGIIAQSKIKKSNGQLSGSGLAIAGMCVSGFMLLLIPLMAAMLLPALAKAKGKAQTIVCMNHMRQLGLAMNMYAANNNGQFPPASTWADAISSDAGSPATFQCPLDQGSRSSYAFNQALSGRKLSTVNPRTVMLFESTAGWNGSGGSSILATGRHPGTGSVRTVVVVYVDGSAELVPYARLATLRWYP